MENSGRAILVRGVAMASLCINPTVALHACTYICMYICGYAHMHVCTATY